MWTGNPAVPMLSLRWASRGPASLGGLKSPPKPLSRSLPGALQGVLLELITADTRKGTDTANGSEMLRAFRWCRGDDSSGNRLPGKDGLDDPLLADPEYNIRRFLGDVGWQPVRSSPLKTFSCSGTVFCSGDKDGDEEEAFNAPSLFSLRHPPEAV